MVASIISGVYFLNSYSDAIETNTITKAEELKDAIKSGEDMEVLKKVSEILINDMIIEHHKKLSLHKLIAYISFILALYFFLISIVFMSITKINASNKSLNSTPKRGAN